MQIINELDKGSAKLASQFLKDGKIIAFATDTIYGIAVDASNDKAVEKLYQVKRRNKNKPIAIFLPDLKAAKEIFIFDDLAKNIAKKFMPGALTLVLETKVEAKKILSNNLNLNNDNFIGFRIIDKKFTQNLFEEFNGILAVSSANLSGNLPLDDAIEIQNQINEIDLIISGETNLKIASTVAKICKGEINILRQGPLRIT